MQASKEPPQLLWGCEQSQHQPRSRKLTPAALVPQKPCHESTRFPQAPGTGAALPGSSPSTESASLQWIPGSPGSSQECGRNTARLLRTAAGFFPREEERRQELFSLKRCL